MFKKIGPYLIPVLFFCACREPYVPPASSTTASYLVVEGVINPGSDSTIIKLSNTVSLTAGTTAKPVVGATVVIQNNQNSTVWPLVGDGHGNYVAVGLNLSQSAQYRLAITTSQGSYLSDFVPYQPTPPVDSIGYNINNGSIQLYVNTHDPTNSTTYYRWDYQETWRFHSAYNSLFVRDSLLDTVVYRQSNQYVFYCFGNDASSSIILGSTQRLSKDIIFQQPLTQVQLSSEKLEDKYSILVRRYALTADAYAFYENLKKNTEQLGTIFDNLPSEVSGNIHSVGTAPQAIGYVTVTNIQSKRIFITEDELPYVPTIYPYSCEVDTAKGNQVYTILVQPPVDYIPINLTSTGYSYSSVACVDCSIRGTTQTPSFWK